MAKIRADYSVYERWYDKYAASVEMKDKKLTERQYMYWYRRARAAKQDMKDFSRTLAMRQRMASELQLRATWAATKSLVKDFKKERKILIKEFITREVEAEERAKNKRISKKELERRVRLRFKKGISPELRELAYDRVSEAMADKIYLINEFESLTWKEFRMNQRSVLKEVKASIDSRDVWDEAFQDALDYVYRK